jgi:hypothetical protein
VLRDSNLGPAVISGFLKRAILDRVEPAANHARSGAQNSMVDVDAEVLSKFCEEFFEYVHDELFDRIIDPTSPSIQNPSLRVRSDENF